MQSLMAGLVSVTGPVGALFSIGVVACAFIDAVFPVPRPGSRWVLPRKVVSALAMNIGYAQNRLIPGVIGAATTLSDVLQTVEVTHAEAERGRAAIVATLATKLLS